MSHAWSEGLLLYQRAQWHGLPRSKYALSQGFCITDIMPTGPATQPTCMFMPIRPATQPGCMFMPTRPATQPTCMFMPIRPATQPTCMFMPTRPATQLTCMFTKSDPCSFTHHMVLCASTMDTNSLVQCGYASLVRNIVSHWLRQGGFHD